MFCRTCFIRHADARRVLNPFGPAGTTQCPFCRRAVSMDDLVEIDTSACTGDGTGASSASSGAPSTNATGAVVTDDEDPMDTDEDTDIPSYSDACTTTDFEAMPMPNGIAPYIDRKFAAVSGYAIARLYRSKDVVIKSDPNFFRKVYGSKVAAVVADVRALLSDEPAAKIVAITTLRVTIAHVVDALETAGVRCVVIDRPNASTSQEAALTEFKAPDDGAPSVLVLHAGTAAAGLTLTCAHHVFLLEPFFKRGEELQAMNRCHRIGQDQPVSCTTYYTKGTLEERLLAFRKGDDTGAMTHIMSDHRDADDSRGISDRKSVV